MKPYSEACERNRQPILERLQAHFRECTRILEIGSGTGQHAVYFAAAMPHLLWQPSDVRGAIEAIGAWRHDSGLANLAEAIELDVRDEDWPCGFDGLFSANTLHIMCWQAVERMFEGIGRVLAAPGVVAIYGPFSYGGVHTSESNRAFDGWLRARDPASGVRDAHEVQALARAVGLQRVADDAMPANNRLLVWRMRD